MTRYLAGIIFCLAFGVSGAAAAQENTVASNDALAFLTLDVENNPGWAIKFKAGYQWKLFRNVGAELTDGMVHAHKKSHTKDGMVGSVGIGYNFGQRLPLTLGLQFGFGPSGKTSQSTQFSNGNSLHSRQKINIYTLDLSADYDFRNCSRWTPFVGLTAGAAFVNQRGGASYWNGAATSAGSLKKRRSVNFMTGARAGVKYDINERLTLSLYGSYNYLGKVSAKNYTIAGGAGTFQVRTKKITAHSIDAKVGLKLSF